MSSCENNLAYELNTDPNFIVASAILGGILFSGISWGFLYVIFFLIIWEFLYYAYTDCNAKIWDAELRLTVILGALLGYLAGANLHGIDDHLSSCQNIWDDCDKYGKACGWN